MPHCLIYIGFYNLKHILFFNFKKGLSKNNNNNQDLCIIALFMALGYDFYTVYLKLILFFRSSS